VPAPPLTPSTGAILPGTLDLLILKAVSLGPLHGYGVLLRIEQLSRGGFLVEQGALYPALYRLIHQGLLVSEWGTSDHNRRARFYRLTPTGRRRLKTDTEGWERLAATMRLVLGAEEA
jgi:transcriptional regulator